MRIFERLRKEIDRQDEIREELIVKSRPILKKSKQSIYAVHRDEIKKAKDLLDEAGKKISDLKNSQGKYPELTPGIYHAALQEYAEAATYYYYVEENRLVSYDELKIDAENYLLGLCDLTGELGRRAVFSVVNEKFEDVKKIHEFVDKIHKEFLKFEFRNSELRRKSDSIKYNMKKIEETLYELKLRGKI